MTETKNNAAGFAGSENLFNQFANLFNDKAEWNPQRIDDEFKGLIAKACKGVSPLEIGLAYIDWLSHLAVSPGKQMQLAQSFFQGLTQLGQTNAEALAGAGKDLALSGDGAQQAMQGMKADWQRWPFNMLTELHQFQKDWVKQATSGVEGVSKQHEQLVQFVSQQLVAALSPANFPFTNPDVIQATIEEQGANLMRGSMNFFMDTFGKYMGQEPNKDQDFVVGENIGITPGKVIFQNNLIELIQYEPVTKKVDKEPVLIVPPWIMKFYILDLSPKNSLVKYLVEQGKTVFMISWKNPREEDADVSFMDYLNQGFFDALAVVNAVCPEQKVNAAGYCLGGTLLCIAAAKMAREQDERLKSITLMTAQADFTEAGEITQFISESQLMFLEKLMWKTGYLDSENMGSAFANLRPDLLVYGPMVDRYLLGKENKGNDLMAWNADGTRMPARMHSEYLRTLYLNNELATDKFQVDGSTVHLSDIKVPVFNLGTETDHVAPWLSVYKINKLVGGEVTFCLTSGGHNAGVVSGPSHPRRRYRLTTEQPGDQFVSAADWMKNNEPEQGSWWPAWLGWLNTQASGRTAPPAMGEQEKGFTPLRDAPGEYVKG